MNFSNKVLFSFSILLILIPWYGMGTIYYVKTDGNDASPGTDWDSAYHTIGKAISRAWPGDSIWVAQGNYLEEETLIIPEITSIYGGFAGTESDLSERRFEDHPSIIDGNDSLQCVINNGILDGFHIIHGKTNSKAGGILNKGMVVNCMVYENEGFQGAGIYNDKGTVTSCTLYNNNTVFEGLGGAINNDLGIIENCIFYNNSAFRGGGIYDYSGTIIHCIIYNNQASFLGGGIESQYGTISECSVFNNWIENGSGGGVNNFSGTIFRCSFWGNEANYGGGISNHGGKSRNVLFRITQPYIMAEALIILEG